jgi:hypothetical protein
LFQFAAPTPTAAVSPPISVVVSLSGVAQLIAWAMAALAELNANSVMTKATMNLVA